MKRIVVMLLTVAMLLTLATVGTSALSSDVDASTWQSIELKAIINQYGMDIMSDYNEDYWAYWWEDDVPETNNYCQAATVNMRGFCMSPDGRFAYLGTLNGGTGVRGMLVYDFTTGEITDLYYQYDGESGLPGSPYSWAKGIAADDRGYVYVGFAYSLNYNVVHLGIAKQLDDGTVEEQSYTPIYEFGNPGDQSGIHVGVNGVDVAKVGDRYYCYAMVNYDYDALYCYDVTDPENPILNTDFGTNGCIIFSEPGCPVFGDGFTLKEGQYMDVDDDGIIWLAANGNEGTDGIMRIAPDGSACAEVIALPGVYSVEHEGAYLLCGLKDGSAVVVLDDSSYEEIARIPLTDEYGDRVTRILVINDILFVCDAGNDNNGANAIHAAALTAEGQITLDAMIAGLTPDKGEDGEDTTTDDDGGDPADTKGEDTTAADTADDTKGEDATGAADDGTKPADGTTANPEPADDGCASSVIAGGALVMLIAAAVVLRRKD